MRSCGADCWGDWCPGVLASVAIGVGIAAVILGVMWWIGWLLWGRYGP